MHPNFDSRLWYVHKMTIALLRGGFTTSSMQKSFMSAGSLTLGGNLSIAVGPLGRNGEALGSVNTSGKVAAMYSYSKTRGLFGGVSIEGSVIMERQDANAQAYRTDVTVKQLLSGAISPPEWAQPLIKTLEACTGMPGGRRWVEDASQRSNDPYMFGSVESPSIENGPSGRDDDYFPDSPGKLSKRKKEKSGSISFPPVTWGRRKGSGSYFSEFHDPSRAPKPLDDPPTPSPKLSPEDRPSPRLTRQLNPETGFFETKFTSDYVSDDQLRQHPPLGRRGPAPAANAPPSVGAKVGNGGAGGGGDDLWEPGSPFNDLPPFSQAHSSMSDATSHRRAFSAYAPAVPSPAGPASAARGGRARDWDEGMDDEDLLGLGVDYGSKRNANGPRPGVGPGVGPSPSLGSKPKLAPKAELTRPLLPHEGIARAIALYDFNAVQVRPIALA